MYTGQPTISHRLTIPTFVLAFVLTAALLAKGMGSLQPPNPALAGFTQGCENKPQPCWYGIEPTTASWDEVIAALEGAAFTVSERMDKTTGLTSIEGFHETSGCLARFNYGGSQAGRGRIILDCPMQLGDYILLAGTPETIASCGGILHYNKGTISLTTTADGSLSPQTMVTQITLTQAQQKSPTAWMGYAPLWKYAEADTYIQKSCA